MGCSKEQKNIGTKQLIRNSTSEFLMFTGQAGEQSIAARYEDESIWLSQKLMAKLFDVHVRTISEHLRHILKSGGLNENSVIRKSRNTAADGKRYSTKFYNLDAIISVGYRVHSIRATQFSQWATQIFLGNFLWVLVLKVRSKILRAEKSKYQGEQRENV